MYNRTHPHRSANGLHLYPFQLIPSASYAPVAADIVIFSLPQDSSGGGKEGVYLPALQIYVGRYAGTYPAHGHTEAHEEMLSAVSTFHLSPPPPPSFTISPSNVRTYVRICSISNRWKKKEEGGNIYFRPRFFEERLEIFGNEWMEETMGERNRALISTPLSCYAVCSSTYVLARAPETRYYWITFLIRPLHRQHRRHLLSL